MLKNRALKALSVRGVVFCGLEFSEQTKVAAKAG